MLFLILLFSCVKSLSIEDKSGKVAISKEGAKKEDVDQGKQKEGFKNLWIEVESEISKLDSSKAKVLELFEDLKRVISDEEVKLESIVEANMTISTEWVLSTPDGERISKYLKNKTEEMLSYLKENLIQITQLQELSEKQSKDIQEDYSLRLELIKEFNGRVDKMRLLQQSLATQPNPDEEKNLIEGKGENSEIFNNIIKLQQKIGVKFPIFQNTLKEREYILSVLSEKIIRFKKHLEARKVVKEEDFDFKVNKDKFQKFSEDVLPKIDEFNKSKELVKELLAELGKIINDREMDLKSISEKVSIEGKASAKDHKEEKLEESNKNKREVISFLRESFEKINQLQQLAEEQSLVIERGYLNILVSQSDVDEEENEIQSGEISSEQMEKIMIFNQKMSELMRGIELEFSNFKNTLLEKEALVSLIREELSNLKYGNEIKMKAKERVKKIEVDVKERKGDIEKSDLMDKKSIVPKDKDEPNKVLLIGSVNDEKSSKSKKEVEKQGSELGLSSQGTKQKFSKLFKEINQKIQKLEGSEEMVMDLIADLKIIISDKEAKLKSINETKSKISKEGILSPSIDINISEDTSKRDGEMILHFQENLEKITRLQQLAKEQSEKIKKDYSLTLKFIAEFKSMQEELDSWQIEPKDLLKVFGIDKELEDGFKEKKKKQLEISVKILELQKKIELEFTNFESTLNEREVTLSNISKEMSELKDQLKAAKVKKATKKRKERRKERRKANAEITRNSEANADIFSEPSVTASSAEAATGSQFEKYIFIYEHQSFEEIKEILETAEVISLIDKIVAELEKNDLDMLDKLKNLGAGLSESEDIRKRLIHLGFKIDKKLILSAIRNNQLTLLKLIVNDRYKKNPNEIEFSDYEINEVMSTASSEAITILGELYPIFVIKKQEYTEKMKK